MAGSAVAKGCGGTGERYLFILKRMSNAVNLRLANAIANKKGGWNALSFVLLFFHSESWWKKRKSCLPKRKQLSFAYFSFTGKEK